MCDLEFPTVPVSTIVASFIENGSVVLRRFADPNRLLQLRYDLDKVYDEVKFVYLLDRELTSRGFQGIFDRVLCSQHQDFIDEFFHDFEYEPYQSFSRRIQPPGLPPVRGAWQAPLYPHLDAFFDPPEFTLKFWLPLRSCGIDAPSLGVVRTSFNDVLDFVGYRNDDLQLDLIHQPLQYDNIQRFNSVSALLHSKDDRGVHAFRTRYANRIWTPCTSSETQYDVLQLDTAFYSCTSRHGRKTGKR